MSSVSILEHSNATDKIKQEINELTESIRLERKKHNEYKILHEVALNCTKDDSELNSELRTKLYNILMTAEVKQCMDLPANNVLLGLSSLNLEDLTYEEKENVRKSVQKGLMDKSRNIFQELQEVGITVSDNSVGNRPALSFSIEDKVLLDFKDKLNEIQKLYVVKLQELMEILEQIIKLKTKVLPEAANEKIHACEVTLELYRLRTEVVNAKSTVDVFMETKKSMDAYRGIMKDILQQQAECKHEVEKLEELKEKYKQVSCKQYSDILKSYLQYKANIEKKRLLYNQLRGK